MDRVDPCYEFVWFGLPLEAVICSTLHSNERIDFVCSLENRIIKRDFRGSLGTANIETHKWVNNCSDGA